MNPRRVFLIPLLCVAISILIAASTRGAQDLPSQSARLPSVAENPSHNEKSGHEYSNEDFVVEQYKTSFRFENDGTGERRLDVRIHMQTDQGVQQFENLTFPYNSAYDKVDVGYVRVVRPDGTTVTNSGNATADVPSDVVRGARPYANVREMRITIDNLHAGDTLEYEVITHMQKPRDAGQFWFEHNFGQGNIVLDEELILSVPKDREIRMKTRGGADPGMRIDSDRKIYTWKRENLSRLADAEGKKKHGGEPAKLPSVEVSTYTSWDQVAKWYGLQEQEAIAPTPVIQTQAAKLTANEATRQGKIEAIYEYVAKQMRHVDLPLTSGGYQPRRAADILDSQVTDSVDQNVLLSSFLESVGIRSETALVAGAQLDPDFPSPAQFDRVITVVPQDDTLLWMDSTSDVTPFLMLAPKIRGKQALLISSTGTTKLTTTPEDPPFASTQDVTVDGSVSELGTLTAHIRYALRGDNELALRSAFEHTPESQRKALAETVATLDGFHGQITSVKTSDPTATHDPFVMDMEYSQPLFFDWTSKRERLPAPLPGIQMPDAPAEHSSSVLLGTPLTITMKMKLQFPAADQTRVPAGMSIERNYAEYRSTYSAKGPLITAQRSMQFKMHDVPGAEAGDYSAFSRAVDGDEARPLLIENPAGGAAVPASAKPDELSVAGAAALDAQNPDEAIMLLKRSAELDPKQKNVFDNLGFAYLRLNRWDDAVSAFSKQLALDARDPQANEYLGLAYRELKKYSDAEAAFHRQLEINPLDSLALSSLGEILLDQQKYAEAAKQLDKATVLIPTDPMLRINLGRALIKTGEVKQAAASLEEAVRVEPKPPIWNLVAYQLADAGLNLNDAQRYAESAVRATEAQLEKSNIQQITAQELAGTAQIASYWDTLGWVYFKQNKLDLAEKFLHCSWLLSERAETADHLGQLYEKRGQKDSAMRMYALSLASANSLDATRNRLVALAGAPEAANNCVKKYASELLAARTISLGKIGTAETKSRYFLLLAPGQDASKVEGVKFAGGDEELPALTDHLRDVNYGQMFPPNSEAKLIRAGTLTCSGSSGECSFVLSLADDIHIGETPTSAHK